MGGGLDQTTFKLSVSFCTAGTAVGFSLAPARGSCGGACSALRAVPAGCPSLRALAVLVAVIAASPLEKMLASGLCLKNFQDSYEIWGESEVKSGFRHTHTIYFGLYLAVDGFYLFNLYVCAGTWHRRTNTHEC